MVTSKFSDKNYAAVQMGAFEHYFALTLAGRKTYTWSISGDNLSFPVGGAYTGGKVEFRVVAGSPVELAKALIQFRQQIDENGTICGLPLGYTADVMRLKSGALVVSIYAPSQSAWAAHARPSLTFYESDLW